MNERNPNNRSIDSKFSFVVDELFDVPLRAIFTCSVLACISASPANCAPLPINQISCDDVRQSAIRISGRGTLPEAMISRFKSDRVIIIGERHGSNEAPEIVGRIATTLAAEGPLLVGLEICTSSQKFIDEFLRTGDLSRLKSSPHFGSPPQDGRGSTAMVKLLCNLRTLAHVQVLAFDPENSTSAEDRDKRMAQCIVDRLEQSSFKHTLLLCGNVHALKCIGTPFDSSYRPMAYELSRLNGSCLQAGDVDSIVVKSQTGITWSLVGGKSGPVAIHAIKGPLSVATHWKSYFMPYKSADSGYNAVIFVKRLTMSPPYFDGNGQSITKRL